MEELLIATKKMSSKEEIQLDVIYQKVEDQVDLEDNPVVVTPVSIKEEEKECCTEKREKCKRRRFCHNACACFGMFTSILIVVYMICVFAVSLRLYNNLHQCFHSKENIYKESSIVDKHINNIHFDVVSGFVFVEFHNKSDIFIRVWDNARSMAHVDSNTFDSGVAISNSSIIIHSVTPAFNFRSCQHAKIEVYIPLDYPQLISINGLVKVGMVHIEGSGKSLANVDVKVEIGKIYVKHTVAHKVSLTTELGLIRAKDILAPQTKIESHTGIIRTHDIFAMNFQSTNQFGCSMHHNLNAQQAKLDTKFGFSVVDKASSLGDLLEINMNTEYGKQLLKVDAKNVIFNLGTTKGRMKVKYEEDDWNCKLDKTSISSMTGVCHPPANTTSKGAVKVGMNTKYGKASLIVDKFGNH